MFRNMLHVAARFVIPDNIIPRRRRLPSVVPPDRWGSARMISVSLFWGFSRSITRCSIMLYECPTGVSK